MNKWRLQRAVGRRGGFLGAAASEPWTDDLRRFFRAAPQFAQCLVYTRTNLNQNP